MILTKELIKSNPKIVFEPRNEEQISHNSIDIRLGPDLWKRKRAEYRDIYLPNDEDQVRQKLISAKEVREKHLRSWALGVVPDDARCFILESGGFYIATTLEKIGAHPPIEGEYSIIPEMKSKSTTGRVGLTTALCAGLGDVGYNSRWALEVRVTDEWHIPIAVGTLIAQVVFHQGSPTSESYGGKDRYQNGDETRFLPKPMKYIGE